MKVIGFAGHDDAQKYILDKEFTLENIKVLYLSLSIYMYISSVRKNREGRGKRGEEWGGEGMGHWS